MLGTFFGAPVPVLSANSALMNSRQIKASQMVLGIAITQPSQYLPRRSLVSGLKKASDGFWPMPWVRRISAANIAECIPKISRWRVWQRRGVGPVKCDHRTSFSQGRGHRLRRGAGDDQAVSLFPFSALLLLRRRPRWKRHRITSGRLGAPRYQRCAALHNQSLG